VPELQLEAVSTLGGFHVAFGDTKLTEVDNLAIVSLAIPQKGDAEFAVALQKAFGADRPAPGRSTLSSDGRTRFLWTAPDQLFALFEDGLPTAAAAISETLDGKAYVTLQSDNWVALRLSGSRAQHALERICPLDLHPAVFAEGQAARTMMEHMGAFLLREGGDSFLLLSASSSAQSFLHAVETSLKNVT
jgi:sarcosine oxidase subunit gamma